MKYNQILSLEPNKIVFYGDIIGFSNDVRQNTLTTQHTEGLNINLPLFYKDIIERYNQDYQRKNGLRFLWISDSIFMITDIDNFETLLSELNYIMNQLYCAHYALRGCITVGEAYCEDNIWGPAVIDAVDGEKEAKYPWIVIKKNLLSTLEIAEDAPFFFKDTMFCTLSYYDFFHSFFRAEISEDKGIDSYLTVYTSFIGDSFARCSKDDHLEKWALLSVLLSNAILSFKHQIDSSNEHAVAMKDGSEKFSLSSVEYLDIIKEPLKYASKMQRLWEVNYNAKH